MHTIAKVFQTQVVIHIWNSNNLKKNNKEEKDDIIENLQQIKKEKIEVSTCKVNFVESCSWKTNILKAIVKSFDKHDAKNE
jgi:hypothetical protein